MKEVAIIGAGPIGLELAVATKRLEIPYYLFEAKQIGNTISSWPDNTRFYSAPERIAIAEVPLQKKDQLPLSGDEYLAYLRSVVELYDLQINAYEKMVEIDKKDTHFELRTDKAGINKKYKVKKVVIATGDMSHHKSLGIPGEDLPHVFDNFKNIHRFFRSRVLIIGGRNSALEAAIRCFRVGVSEVSISYRRQEFDKNLVKIHLIKEIELLLKKHKINFYPSTVPVKFDKEQTLLLDKQSNEITVQNDFVVKCIGYQPDLTLLKKSGLILQGEHQEPQINWETMESNVQGLYVAGTIAKGIQDKHQLFIGTCHHHVEKIIQHISGKPYSSTGAYHNRKYDFDWDDVQFDQ